MNVILKSREGWLLILIFTFFGISYIYNLTYSGLWYDEAIEYFYSKYMIGPVPVNPVDQSGSNMYERICITYQPPLYNFLMYFWLLFYDNEGWFRLAGVITTFLGSIGFYCAIRRLVGYKLGAIGLCIYLSTAAVAIYALECAEYNLMLCMECWMLYFFVVCIQYRQAIVEWRALVGFFVFASLSVYSQYGASFFIVGLVIALCITYIKYKNWKSLSRLCVMGAITCIVAIIPLYVFFVRIQLTGQGTDEISHAPVFVGNFLSGIPYSLAISFYEQIKWIFSTSLIWGWRSLQIMLIVIVAGFACTFYAVFHKQRLCVLLPSIAATVICYLLFFVLSACSYYAYNSWDGLLGCYNIIKHTRYILFFVPLLVFTFYVGIISMYKILEKRNLRRLAIGSLLVILFFFISNVVWGLHKGRIKSDTREVTMAWLARKDYVHKVVVQEWESGAFMHYLQHSPEYNDEIKKRVILTKHEIRISEKVESHLQELGVFDLQEFYFIGRKHVNDISKEGEIRMISNLFTKKGYNVQTIWSGSSALLYVSKKNV